MSSTSARPKILVTQKVPDPAYPPLEAIGDVEANMKEGVIWPYEELLRRGPAHDYIYSLLTDNIDARFLETCAASNPRLKMVANMAVGYNNIDVEAATRLGIAVSNTPGVLSDTTGDLAFALLMATARRIPEAERFLRAGKYTGWGPLLFCGAEVHHSTLGLIGAGRIGKIMTKRASGFEMKVIYYDVYRMSPEDEAAYHLRIAENTHPDGNHGQREYRSAFSWTEATKYRESRSFGMRLTISLSFFIVLTRRDPSKEIRLVYDTLRNFIRERGWLTHHLS